MIPSDMHTTTSESKHGDRMEGNEKCRADGYVQGRKGITNYHTMNMKVARDSLRLPIGI